MSTTGIRVSAAIAAAALLALAQKLPPELGMGWLPEFNYAAKQTVGLAEAIPADRFSWRPREGVRSISEVYVHIAAGNYALLRQAGVNLPEDAAAKLKANPEKTITAKADVIAYLKASQELVRTSYPTADRSKRVKLFGDNDTTADGVFLRILVHNHEHMGQSIAYARMIGVVPPWSQ